MIEKLQAHEAMLCHSEGLASVQGKSIDAPHCPVQTWNAQHLPHLHLQPGIVPWVHLDQQVDLLHGVVFGDGEARVVRGGVIDGTFGYEIGDIIGKVVAADVVVIDEVHALTGEQNIQVVEIIVTQPHRRIPLRQKFFP